MKLYPPPKNTHQNVSYEIMPMSFTTPVIVNGTFVMIAIWQMLINIVGWVLERNHLGNGILKLT